MLNRYRIFIVQISNISLTLTSPTSQRRHRIRLNIVDIADIYPMLTSLTSQFIQCLMDIELISFTFHLFLYCHITDNNKGTM